MARSPYVLTSAAVAATAALGGAGTDVRSRWYRRLDEPSWDPPGQVYGPVWTAIYALTAVGTGRALTRVPDRAARRGYLTALGINLALNAGWSWVFFRGHRPGWATAEAAALEASTLDLLRRTWRLDRTGGVLLAPYAGWVGFATALSAEIARRNDAG